MKKIVPIYPYHPKIIEQIVSERPDLSPVEAIPGGPGPVVAIRKLPPFACDAILVEKPEFLKVAVSVAVDAPAVRLVSMGENLARLLKASPDQVKEVVKWL